MSALTIGDFATDLTEVVNSLNNIAEKLNLCDLDLEIASTPGLTIICSVPIFRGGICAAPDKERFTVRDLNETVEAIRDWINDIQSELGGYDPATTLGGDASPPPDESTSA